MLKMFKGSKNGSKNAGGKIKKRAEKSVYARYISRYKWYCPAGFDKTDAALAFLIAIIAFTVLPYALSPLMLLLNGAFSTVELYCVSSVLSQAVILAVALIFCKKRGVPVFSGGGYYCKFDFKLILPAVLLTIATAVLITPVHTDFAEYLSNLQTFLGVGSGGDTIIDLADFGFNDLCALVILYLIVVPVLPAICEEALFRGVIARGLGELGVLGGAVLSGLLFALMHGNYSQLLLQFVLGAEIGYIVLKSGNFAAGVAMHFTNNAFAIVYALIIAFSEGSALGAILSVLLIALGAVCLVLAVFAFVKYFKRNSFKNEYKLANSLCCLKRADASDKEAFTVRFEQIKTPVERAKNGFNDCEYFYNGKFYGLDKKIKPRRFSRFNSIKKLTKKLSENGKNDRRFAWLLGAGIVIASALIVIDFFI